MSHEPPADVSDPSPPAEDLGADPSRVPVASARDGGGDGPGGAGRTDGDDALAEVLAHADLPAPRAGARAGGADGDDAPTEVLAHADLPAPRAGAGAALAAIVAAFFRRPFALLLLGAFRAGIRVGGVFATGLVFQRFGVESVAGGVVLCAVFLTQRLALLAATLALLAAASDALAGVRRRRDGRSLLAALLLEVQVGVGVGLPLALALFLILSNLTIAAVFPAYTIVSTLIELASWALLALTLDHRLTAPAALAAGAAGVRWWRLLGAVLLACVLPAAAQLLQSLALERSFAAVGGSDSLLASLGLSAVVVFEVEACGWILAALVLARATQAVAQRAAGGPPPDGAPIVVRARPAPRWVFPAAFALHVPALVGAAQAAKQLLTVLGIPEWAHMPALLASQGLPLALGLWLLVHWGRRTRAARLDADGVLLDPGPAWPGTRIGWERIAGFRLASDGVWLRLHRRPRLLGAFVPAEDATAHAVVVALEARGVPSE